MSPGLACCIQCWTNTVPTSATCHHIRYSSASQLCSICVLYKWWLFAGNCVRNGLGGFHQWCPWKFRIFWPPPPLVTYMITQLISTLVHFSTTPLPPSSADVIDGSPLRAGCYSWAALYLMDSMTLYSVLQYTLACWHRLSLAMMMYRYSNGIWVLRLRETAPLFRCSGSKA